MDAYLDVLRREIRPALGCTEPIAVALAVARAREALGLMPDQVELRVSRNILKNAMGVGIPGTGMVGLEIASALSLIAGHSAYGLEVLSDATPRDCEAARAMLSRGSIHVRPLQTHKKLHIEAELRGGGHVALCVIEDSHDHITLVSVDGEVIERDAQPTGHAGPVGDYVMDIQGIYRFCTTVDATQIAFLDEVMAVNEAIALEGLKGDYGLRVGKVLHGGTHRLEQVSLRDYAVALTAAAADARMAGCTLHVMSTAGSGNQGLTATLPVVAIAGRLGVSPEVRLRAQALSQLVTIHIKHYIGRLSPLCGCAIAASIGSACAITYLMGGDLSHIEYAIQNMIADISGLICDGAKPGCALKIATSVSSALQCAQLALANVGAGRLDGIIAEDVEQTIKNLGSLGNDGMDDTDRVILDMMIAK